MAERILSQEGLDQLKKELKDLRDVKRPEIVRRVEDAKELGDLSENAEYHDAKDQLALVDNRLNELDELIGLSVVVKKTEGSVIGMGSSVQVRVDKASKLFKIVGASEADPAKGHISTESPIGKALVGHTIGDEVAVETPAGTTMFVVESVQ